MANGLLQYLKDEYKAMNDGNELNDDNWDTVDCSRDIPQQMNGECI